MSDGGAMDQQSLALASKARVRVLEMCSRAKAPHIASSLSCIDILAVLYSGAASVRPAGLREDDRDYVVVSKGHAASATYAVLAEAGFFPVEWLNSYGFDESPLGGHVTHTVPGVELSTGSLGHGLPFGAGVALANRRMGSSAHVFVVMSDGECDEGTSGEAALFAGHHGLGGLTVFIDRNRIQSLAGTEDTLKLEPLSDKWRAFNWHTLAVDGHDHPALAEAVASARIEEDRPTVVICDTVKGKGVSFMEDQVVWHYRPPSLEQALAGISEVLHQGAQ